MQITKKFTSPRFKIAKSCLLNGKSQPVLSCFLPIKLAHQACTSDQCRSRSIGLLEVQLSGRQSRLAVSPWHVPARLRRKTEEVTHHKVLPGLGADLCT